MINLKKNAAAAVRSIEEKTEELETLLREFLAVADTVEAVQWHHIRDYYDDNRTHECDVQDVGVWWKSAGEKPDAPAQCARCSAGLHVGAAYCSKCGNAVEILEDDDFEHYPSFDARGVQTKWK